MIGHVGGRNTRFILLQYDALELFFEILLDGVKSDMESWVCACVLSLDSSPNRQHLLHTRPYRLRSKHSFLTTL